MAVPRNLITDVAGIRVGQAQDTRLASGVTAVIFDPPAAASVDVRGGAPASRETDLLEPHRTVQRIDAVVLSGGSAFGLDAAAGVQACLREQRRGFAIGEVRVPIVCAAALFDLTNGGDKNWGRFSPYRDLGHVAACAAGPMFQLGTAGAGFGATTVNYKGGIGSASAITTQGHTVGAVVAVNACGSAVVGSGPHFWAAPFERQHEFGGLGFPAMIPPTALSPLCKGSAGTNTTIALVATDVDCTKAQLKQIAAMAHDGMARAIYPAHTTLDGDTIFAAATGQRALADPLLDLTEIGLTCANVLARAIARAVFEATALPGGVPSWRDCHS